MIIKITLYLYMVMTLIGCQMGHKIPSRNVDAQLEPYARAFETIYGLPIKYRVALVPDLGGNTVGLCRYRVFVRIDAEYFDYYNGRSRNAIEQVMFHEFGHCTAGLDHDDRIFQTGPMAGCPVSLMNSYTFVGWCYDVNREYYLKELGEKMGIVIKTPVGDVYGHMLRSFKINDNMFMPGAHIEKGMFNCTYKHAE